MNFLQKEYFVKITEKIKHQGRYAKRMSLSHEEVSDRLNWEIRSNTTDPVRTLVNNRFYKLRHFH